MENAESAELSRGSPQDVVLLIRIIQPIWAGKDADHRLPVLADVCVNGEKKQNLVISPAHLQRMVDILLSGDGRRADVRLVRLLSKQIPEGGRLLYIPVAIPLDRFTFGQCYDWITATHRKNGPKAIDMWTDLTNRRYEDLARYSAIFIGGGNTFNLLKQVRESGFDSLLLRYIKSGKPVFGGSAGAIILGKDIGTASFGGDADDNMVGLKDLRGLDVVRGYSIACHHNGMTYDRLAAEYSERTGIPVIALRDGTGVQVSKDQIFVNGPSTAKVFDGRKSKVFKAGTTIG